MSGDLTARFSGANLSNFPDPHTLDSDRLIIFWTLWVFADECNHPAATAQEISDVLRNCCQISISRQFITAQMNREGPTISKTKIGKRRVYQLMKTGQDELGKSSRTVRFIDPDNAYDAIQAVEQIFLSLNGSVRICDPYVDKKTIEWLLEINSANEVRLLTVRIDREVAFRRNLAAFNKQKNNLCAVRVAQPGRLHDRYILDENNIYLFGTSLNYLGRKQTFVTKVGEDIRRLASSFFEAEWDSAVPFRV